jgi:hypothetical protein
LYGLENDCSRSSTENVAFECLLEKCQSPSKQLTNSFSRKKEIVQHIEGATQQNQNANTKFILNKNKFFSCKISFISRIQKGGKKNTLKNANEFGNWVAFCEHISRLRIIKLMKATACC